MSAHTPGPWHIETTQHDDVIDAIAIKDDYHLFIAGVEPHHELVMECIANAALIASAPELLAVLREVAHEIDQTYDGTSVPRITVEIWGKVRAAIAKAEGQS